MSRDSITASNADMIEEQKRERESIERDLADFVQRIRRARQRGTEAQEMPALNEAIRRARLRMIALARSEGTLAWMMSPDPISGDNVVRFRRRVRVR